MLFVSHTSGSAVPSPLNESYWLWCRFLFWMMCLDSYWMNCHEMLMSLASVILSLFSQSSGQNDALFSLSCTVLYIVYNVKYIYSMHPEMQQGSYQFFWVCLWLPTWTSIFSPVSPQVITNCVCAPDQSLNTVGAFAVAPLRPSLHPQQPPAPHNRVLAHMWQVVQNNNGIKVRLKGELHALIFRNCRTAEHVCCLCRCDQTLEFLQVLLSLLSVKMPITDADLIRALACKALVGLSRSSAIRQIISKLPLFTSSHIQQVRHHVACWKLQQRQKNYDEFVGMLAAWLRLKYYLMAVLCLQC